MQDDLVPIRLDQLYWIFRKYAHKADWSAFRQDVIAHAAVMVDDGKGHPEPRSYGGDGPTYA